MNLARAALSVAATLSVVASARRHVSLPTTLTLAALTALNWACATTSPHLAAAAWFLWPAPATVLAWRTWRGRGAWFVCAAALAYAVAAVFGPWSWIAHPRAWWFVQRAPFLAGAALGAVAWLTRQKDGELGDDSKPSPASPSPTPHVPGGIPADDHFAPTSAGLADRTTSYPPQQESPRPLIGAHPAPTRGDCVDPNSNAHQTAEQVAALLTLSAVLDVTVGALGPGAAWSTKLACATWIAVCLALIRGTFAPCAAAT